MALSADTTIFEVRTGGSDTLNGGAFDTGPTAGMFTDGAATSATGASPVFSSASYNFVAGDVGARVYIASGANWTAGWYEIASVASNVATLSAALGAGALATQQGMTAAAGCATTASPTGATWTIDYSQQDAAQFAYTDLASAGTGLTVSSVAKPFAKQQVGNSIVITGGTNFNAGRYVIVSVAAVTFIATVVGPTNITTGAGVNGTGGLGGGVANPGTISGLHSTSGCRIYIKAGTYTISSTTANVTNGRISVNRALVVGYSTNRHMNNTDTKPILQATVGSFTMFTGASLREQISNVTLDGNGQSSVALTSAGKAVRCHLTGQSAECFTTFFLGCTMTACSAALGSNTVAMFCEAYSNTATPFKGTVYFCISRSNTGASTDGFAFAQGIGVGCVAYSNGRNGFTVEGLTVNCIAESNAGVGFAGPGSTLWTSSSIHNAAYNNTGGATSGTPLPPTVNFLTITDGSVFVNAAAGDFSLNNTALRGALLRAAGYPALFPSGLTASYRDIGAAQHQDAGGGSSIVPNIFDNAIIRGVPHDSD